MLMVVEVFMSIDKKRKCFAFTERGCGGISSCWQISLESTVTVVVLDGGVASHPRLLGCFCQQEPLRRSASPPLLETVSGTLDRHV